MVQNVAVGAAPKMTPSSRGKMVFNMTTIVTEESIIFIFRTFSVFVKMKIFWFHFLLTLHLTSHVSIVISMPM